MLESLPVSSRLPFIVPFLRRIDLATGKVTLHVCPKRLAKQLNINIGVGETDDTTLCQTATDGACARKDPSEEVSSYPVALSITLKRRGVESHLILTTTQEPKRTIYPLLVRTVAKAHVWFDELKSSSGTSVKSIADRECIPAREVSRQLPLAFLSPEIVTSILRGEQPIELTTKRLTRLTDLPFDWIGQAKTLGFSKL